MKKAEQQVSTYRLVRRLPGGAMGEVWIARHANEADARYAIKFLKDEYLDDEALKDRFRQECNVHQDLSQKYMNIVPAHGVIYDPPGLVMDYISKTLAAELKTEKPLDCRRAVSIALGVLEALKHAHKEDVIHRDIKPENILLTDDGVPLLTDFGIAIVIGEARKTRPGSLYGTPEYMSPEQKDGKPDIDAQSDIYSFGCVFYQMLTGTLPDVSRDEGPQAPSRLNKQVPVSLNRVVLSCLHKDRQVRFLSAEQVIKGIQDIPELNTAPSASVLPPKSAVPPVGDPFKTSSTATESHLSDALHALWKQYWRWATGVLSALLLIFTYLLWRHNQAPPPPPTPEAIVLRLYGSTSIGDKVALDWARSFAQTRFGVSQASCSKVEREYKGQRVVMQHCGGETPSSHRQIIIEVYSAGSEIAFECLAARICDIGMSSRPFDPKDPARYAGLENLSNEGSEHIIGLDGIAIVVHPDNHIPKLTLDQVKRIFCKTNTPITQWAQLGVSDLGSIHRVIRNAEGGTREMFLKMACSSKDEKGEFLDTRAEDQLPSKDLASLVASRRNAIGFISSSLSKGLAAVKLAPSDNQRAFPPENFAIAMEDYPMTRRLYLFNRAEVSDTANDFISFATGEDGQRIAQQNHIVPLIAEPVPVSVPADAPAELQIRSRDSRRLTLSFRFESGQANFTLDRLAADNIDRVYNYAHRYPTTEFLVFGFADNTRRPGRGNGNPKLSLLRAHAIAEKLREKGMRVGEEKGFGESMPVASNDNEDGRNRNRRAEIWVRP